MRDPGLSHCEVYGWVNAARHGLVRRHPGSVLLDVRGAPQDQAENGRVHVSGARLLDRRACFVHAIQTYIAETEAQVINGRRTQLNALLSWCERLIRSAKELSIAINESGSEPARCVGRLDPVVEPTEGPYRSCP